MESDGKIMDYNGKMHHFSVHSMCGWFLSVHCALLLIYGLIKAIEIARAARERMKRLSHLMMAFKNCDQNQFDV